MKAKLVTELKERYRDGSIVQIRIWQLPTPSTERPHGYKYSLFYGWSGQRIVCYDNERGKGDHRHYRSHEETYKSRGIEQLIADFSLDVRRERAKS